MELTPRLKLAADFCLPCHSIIDVGCDHAYLCLHLVEQRQRSLFAAVPVQQNKAKSPKVPKKKYG